MRPRSAAVYAVALAGMFGASALYHRVAWRPALRPWFRRLDHSMIFVLIAGTCTPVTVLGLDGRRCRSSCSRSVGRRARRRRCSSSCGSARRGGSSRRSTSCSAGSASCCCPRLARRTGIAPALLFVAGGALYTAGAVIYMRQRPDPRPAVFGFHELFHVFVIAAAIAHFVAIAAFVVPRG